MLQYRKKMLEKNENKLIIILRRMYPLPNADVISGSTVFAIDYMQSNF